MFGSTSIRGGRAIRIKPRLRRGVRGCIRVIRGLGHKRDVFANTGILGDLISEFGERSIHHAWGVITWRRLGKGIEGQMPWIS